MNEKASSRSPRSERRLGDDERAWLVIGVIDVVATLAVVGLYVWFVVHAAA